MFIPKELIYMLFGYILCPITAYLYVEYDNWRNKKLMENKGKKTDIWLVIKNTEKNFVFTKYFETEFEKDKYKRRLKHIRFLRLVEDSTDINYNYS